MQSPVPVPPGHEPPPGPYWPQQRTRIGLGMAALIVYLWVIHSYKLPIGDVATLALGLGVLLRGEPIRFPAPVVLMGVFVVWTAVGMSVTTSTVITWEAVFGLIKLWVILVGIVNVVRTAADLRVFAIAWLALFALYPVRGAFYNQYVCHCTEFGRVAWNFVFANPNDLAALSLVPLGLAAGVAYVERVKLIRLAGMAGVGVLALLIMLTQSRGAMLALAVATVILVVGSRRKGRDLAILTVMFAVAAVSAPKTVWNRLAGLTNVSVRKGMEGVDPENSAASRWQIWQIAAYTVQQNPIMGVGGGMMPMVHRTEAARRGSEATVQGVRDTHSTYLRVAAEYGLPGLILFLSMWGFLIRYLQRVRRTLRDFRPREHQLVLFVELAIIAFMVAGLFGSFERYSFTYLSVGMAWLVGNILEREPWYGPPVAQAVPHGAMRRRTG